MTARNETGRLGGQPEQEVGLIKNSRSSIPSWPLSVNRNDLYAAIGRARNELGVVIERPISDGRLHRCPVEGGRPGNLDGAYRACLDHPANLWAMNYRTGRKVVFPFGGSSSSWSPADRRDFAAKVEQDRKARETEQRAAWAEAAERAERIYADSQRCTGHPYLTAKGVKPFNGLRVSSGKDLIVPIYDGYSALTTLQFIDESGRKRFLSGGRKSGCFLSLTSSTTDRHGPVLIAEGLATALSLIYATNFETLVAFDANNLKPIALGSRRAWPDRVIVLCADNDAGGTLNTGAIKAREAALTVEGLLTIPFMAEGQACDFNDMYQAEGSEAVRALVEAAFEVRCGNA